MPARQGTDLAAECERLKAENARLTSLLKRQRGYRAMGYSIEPRDGEALELTRSDGTDGDKTTVA